MNYAALLVGVYIAVSSLPKGGDQSVTDHEWHMFKSRYNKVYQSSSVELMRRKIYTHNKLILEKHDEMVSHQQVTYTLGLNNLADTSYYELEKVRNLYRDPNGRRIVTNSIQAETFLLSLLDNNDTVPRQLDWRHYGRVTSVKDQGDCASSWAFAAVGVLEGQEEKRNISNLVSLSTQDLLDCDRLNHGCKGGWTSNAFDSIKLENGISKEDDYPYVGSQSKCQSSWRDSHLTDEGPAILPEANEEKLKVILAKYGPVAVAIDANDSAFQLYTGGVFNPPTDSTDCSHKREDLNHAVLLVGYGSSTDAGDYWIVVS